MDNSNPNQPPSPFDPNTARREGGFTPPDAANTMSGNPQSVPSAQPETPTAQEAQATTAEMPTAPAGPELSDLQAYMANNAHAVTPSTKKKRNIGASLSVAAVLVLLLGGLAAYWLINNVAGRPAVSVDKLLPANTMAYFTLDTAPDAAEKAALDRMKQAFESQPGFKEAWAQISSLASAGTGDLSEATPNASDPQGFDSLAQYLGNNITIALLPFSSDDMKKLEGATELGEDPTGAAGDVFGNNAVGLVDLDFNPLDKKGPISDLKKQADKFANAELVEKYRDVEIRKYVTDTTTVFFSLLNGTSTAVVAAKAAPIHVVIDQFKDNKGLSTDATYLSLTGQVPQERIATFYLNLTKIYDLAKASAGSTGMLDTMSPLLADPNARVEGSVLMTVSAHDDGMQLDVASKARTDGMSVGMNPGAKPDTKLISDIPTGSLGFFLGTDLKTVIQSTLDSLRKADASKGQGLDSGDPVTSALDQFMQQTGLDLEKDVLPLLGGDYALSVSTYTKDGSVQPSVIFQVKLSDRDTARAKEVVDKLANAMSGGNAEKVSGLSDPFYNLVPAGEEGAPAASIGVTKDRLVFIFDMDALAIPTRVNGLLSGLGKGLGTEARWQEVPRNLPKDSNAIVYVDITGIRTMMESQMPADEKSGYEQSAAPFVRPFKYIAVGSVSGAPDADKMSTGHSILFIGIGK